MPTGRRMKVSETFIALFHRRAQRATAPPPRDWPPLRRRLLAVRAGVICATVLGTRTIGATLAAALPAAAACAAWRRGLIRRDDDFQAVAQAVGAVDDDALAGRETRRDGGRVAVDRAGHDRTYRDA